VPSVREPALAACFKAVAQSQHAHLRSVIVRVRGDELDAQARGTFLVTLSSVGALLDLPALQFVEAGWCYPPLKFHVCREHGGFVMPAEGRAKKR
jgi:hypothetical protein